MASGGCPEVAIGIDLGTTNSCVAVYRNGQVEIIRNENGRNITPSVVSFGDIQRHIGDGAKVHELTNPENTVYGIKRLIGREFSDPSIQNDIKHWPFTVVSVIGKPAVKVKYLEQEKIFQPEEISAMVLEKMKSIAEAHLGHEVKDAVITVPAYFDNNQRQATKVAGQIAGLNVLRLMNEPTAAAVAYGLEKRGGSKRNVLVYDLGGGTFDISILSIEAGTFRVKAIKGDTHLGGEDFDSKMVEYFVQEIKTKNGKDVMADKYALRRLRHACEKVKVTLSTSSQANFEISKLLRSCDFDFDTAMTRPKFEELNKELFEGTIDMIKLALEDSGIDKSRIDDVVLVGGSTRIPKVQSLLKDFFQRQRLNKGINPDEAVAYGAAIQAALIKGDPSKKLQNLMLYDVVPLSLGVNVIGGIMSTIVQRNTRIPITRSRNYTTTVDNQTDMHFKVYEGERLMVKDNNFLGEMVLTGIPPEPRGYASVNVYFEIDEDCILNAKAVDQDSGNHTNVQIINNSKKLNESQVERLVRDAELNRLHDALNVQRVQAMNELEFYIHDIKSALKTKDFDSTIAPREKESILNQVQEVSNWLESSIGKAANTTTFQEKQTALETIWNPIITMKMSYSMKSRSGNKPVILLGE